MGVLKPENAMPCKTPPGHGLCTVRIKKEAHKAKRPTLWVVLKGFAAQGFAPLEQAWKADYSRPAFCTKRVATQFLALELSLIHI